MIIVNADDWGRSVTDTDATLICCRAGGVTAVSAMMFMADSERAAQLAQEHSLDVGLHLNLSEVYSGRPSSEQNRKQQARLVTFLTRSNYALLIYHPLLRESFRSVFSDQYNEFLRVYGKEPTHIDGHQHMHLSSNILFDRLIPKGLPVRRSFSFWPGEKSILNRAYRALVDGLLARRYHLTDYFFSLETNLQKDTLPRVIELAKSYSVEMMTHARNPMEFDFLKGERRRELFQSVKQGNFLSGRSA